MSNQDIQPVFYMWSEETEVNAAGMDERSVKSDPLSRLERATHPPSSR